MGDAGRDGGAGDLDAGRVGEAPLGEGLNRGRHGGREKERLAAFPWAEIDDFPDLGEEAHVEHPVHFVEDEHFDFSETHGGAVEVIHEAAWSGDDDVCPGGELLGLGTDADTAVKQGDLHAGVFAVFFKLLGDLMGEFASRLKDEDLGFPHFSDLRKRGKRERGSLAGAGLGRANDVLTFENNRNRLRLDRCRRGVSGLLNGFQDGCGEPKCVKSHAAD